MAKRRAGSGIIAQLTRGKTRYNEGWSRENRPIIITRLRGAVIVPIRRTEGTGNRHEMEQGLDGGVSRFVDNGCAREVM